jgi:galactose mutarotase-like enzyme
MRKARRRVSVTLRAGDLEAVFLPAQGMLCASLRHHEAELLRRTDDLPARAARGSQAGIPLLHPWANRLEGLRYRAAGRDVLLDANSSRLHFDANGLPIHGVPWPRLAWDVTASSSDRLAARLDWSDRDLLAVFPFPHRLDLAVTLAADTLTFATTLVAGDGVVPVAFGFHPHFGLPGLARERWRLEMPPLGRLVLDERRIPTGELEPFDRFDAELGARTFDDGFALQSASASIRLSGGGQRISVELDDGYSHVQIWAPPGEDLVAIEPMTAPANALASGRGLVLVAAGGRYRAVFRVRVSSATR